MSRLVVVCGLPGTAVVSALVARVLPSGALVAPPVVPGQAGHEQLGIDAVDFVKEPLCPDTTEDCRQPAVVANNDLAVAPCVPAETVGRHLRSMHGHSCL